MDNNLDKKVKANDKFRMIFMVILLLLLIVPLAFISYDKFFNKETPPEPTPSLVPTDDTYDDTITIFNRINIDENEQVINVDGVQYKIKKEISVDGVFLLINGETLDLEASEIAYADFAYITNKFIIFTLAAQDGEAISYVMDKNGNEITYNSNNYQMSDIKLVDGNIEARGHVFCGLDGDCPDKDLIFKYEDNMITVDLK